MNLKKILDPQARDVAMYDERFSEEDVSFFVENKIEPSLANSFNRQITSWNIYRFVSYGVEPDLADRILQRFWVHDECNVAEPDDLDSLARMHVPWDKSFAYPQGLNLPGFILAKLYQLGISPDFVRDNSHLGDLFMFLCGVDITNSEYVPMKVIGTGGHSIVFLREGTCWKFSKDVLNEYDNLKKIQDYYNGAQKNLPRISGKLQLDYGFELEHLLGNQLQDIVLNHLSQEKVVFFAGEVLHGLQELRTAGIYHHRDIRPANIMIDQENDRAVIIDLGIATTERYAEPQDNCRFGGPNDLVSLGQVMYFMSTQKHLFTESDSMHVTRIKQDLKDERDFVYADPTGERLKPYLEKVTQDVIGLADVIHACLQAKGTDEDYQKLGGMFNA
jgi:hypothetical protein